jgi:hypothetical protein
MRNLRTSSIRRHWLLRTFAIWLILLVISPVTLPFATCDVDEAPLVSTLVHAANSADAKTTGNTACLAVILPLASVQLRLSPVVVAASALRTTGSQSLFSLRI